MIELRVLAVDDEPGMRSAIERVLSRYVVDVPEADVEVSFKVECAASGEDAVKMIGEAAPDIMLLDYKLPGISGIDVLNRCSETGDDADMLTVMITAYASIETAITATKRGAYDFLPKPFTPSDLKHTIRRAASRLVLARRAKELEDANKRVRFEFIRVLGHELKAPLAAVSGYLMLMQDKVLGEDIAAYEEPVSRSLQRLAQMRKLIIDLLDMTRLESGQKQRDLECVNVSGTAMQSVELVRVEAESRGITFDLAFPEKTEVFADTGEIEMIMNNLVSNAVKYNRDGGVVKVEIAFDEGLKITVSDTGIGMTEEEVEKLFGEFVRIKNEDTRHILGSGLGLSIIKRIAELYEGEVKVKSRKGEGSAFSVVLKNINVCGNAVQENQNAV